MTFAELVIEVYLITNRPDLVARTASVIKAATLKAHKSDFFSKDIHETGVIFDTSEFRQSLDYITLIPNLRAFKYLRKADDAEDDAGIFFTIITPEEILDEYGVNKADIAYVAGRVLEIRSSTEFQFALLGCYVLPVVTDGNYASWVAEQYPFAIIHDAARRIFLSIGQREEANGEKSLADDEYAELAIGAITDVGH